MDTLFPALESVIRTVGDVKTRTKWIAWPAIALLAISLASCRGKDVLPSEGSEAYREVVTDFYSAAARIQTSQEQGAAERLLRAAESARGEPSVWYNLAVLSLRRNDLEAASGYLQTARGTGVVDSRVLLLSGIVERRLDNAEAALEHLRAAVRADSTNVRALFALATEATYQGQEVADVGPDELIDRIVRLRPDNTAAIIEALRRAAEGGNRARLSDLLPALRRATSNWPADIAAAITALEAETSSADLPDLTSAILRLGNTMKRVDAHRASLAELEFDPLDPGLVMTRFVALPSPSGRTSAADTALVFERAPLTPDRTPWNWLGTVFLSDQGPLVSAAANRATIRLDPDIVLPFPGGRPTAPFPHDAAAFFDYDYDFRMDLAVAGDGGLKIFRQEAAGSFSEATTDVGVSRAVASQSYAGIWALDIDLEGDMDLVLSTTAGPMRLLRNNGDDTFTDTAIFGAVENIRQMTWADLDDDGDPDALMLDAGGAMHLFLNERSGTFTHRRLSAESAVLAIHVTDFDGNGTFDGLYLDHAGVVTAATWDAGQLRTRTLLQTADQLPSRERPSVARIHANDVDNNGGLDLLVTIGEKSAIWLQTSDRRLALLSIFDDLHLFEAADLNATGNLNLVALDREGAAVHLVNGSRTGYLSRSILPRAAESLGDRRINSFGIGGEIELRSGLLYQKRLISSPLVHFGLGDRVLVDVARIIWPNGTSQAQFDLESDQTLMARQSLKGSCPWVFTFDGDRMRFVTDFIWRSPLGLRINAVETAGVVTTEDWIKIDGSELAPKNGMYDVRVTAELWETHFFDLIKLRAVDHPTDTEIFVNEVFVFPPDELAVHVTGPLRPVRGAWDHSGNDVTSRISRIDGEHVDSFELYSHQGRTREHYVELELSDVPSGVPAWLVAFGWIRPTDSSINVAIGQGDHPRPQGVRLDVREDDGSWTTVHADLGFPSGKDKTMLMDLTGIFENKTSRRVRLATNLEIYWDAFSWAEKREPDLARVMGLTTASAELRYRGFSLVQSDRRSSPEVPVYDSLASGGPQWRDLIGFYTRFGDIRELLEDVDDRYLIMNAGDEVIMNFEALPPPPEGWTRDFVLVGDGWVKDGDYNTTYSKTVLPLPEHGESDYSAPRLRLADNPAFLGNPDDWIRFHTRYVSTANYVKALRAVR